MTFTKRKKNTRQRGTHTHGWGSKKKHRGAGSRGGHGGTGKRGDSLKPSIWKNKKYFGKHGFKSVEYEKINAINICDIQNTIRILVKKGFAQEKSGGFIIDLESLGYNKLLGNGNVANKFEIKVKYASANAIEKIEKAGGKVEVKVSPEESAGEPVEEVEAVEEGKEEPVKEKSPVKEEKKSMEIKSPDEIIKEVKGQ